MTAAAKHIIKKQTLEVHIPSRQQHRAVSEQVTELYYREVLPQLSQLFDRLAPPGITFSIDRLSIDLGVLTPNALDKALPDRFLEAAEKALSELLPEAFAVTSDKAPGISARTQHQSLETVFTTFLETGAMPWWHPVTAFDDFEKDILALPAGRLMTLIRDAVTSPIARRRLVMQFSEGFFREIYTLLAPDSKRGVHQLRSSLLKKEQLLMAAVLQTGDQGPQKEEAPLLSDIENSSDRRLGRENKPAVGMPVIPDDRKDIKRPGGPVGEEYYITNAGLILLWPFLELFFDALGLLRDGAFKNDAARQRAVHLTEYLVSGRSSAKEYELTLNKLLCGHRLEAPLIPRIKLTVQEKQESEQLLLDVIGHWTALGDTSPAALQESFLQREGKLLREGSRWRLQVEQKPYDMLLASLPWGVGMVKLGEQLIIVDWA